MLARSPSDAETAAGAATAARGAGLVASAPPLAGRAQSGRLFKGSLVRSSSGAASGASGHKPQVGWAAMLGHTQPQPQPQSQSQSSQFVTQQQLAQNHELQHQASKFAVAQHHNRRHQRPPIQRFDSTSSQLMNQANYNANANSNSQSNSNSSKHHHQLHNHQYQNQHQMQMLTLMQMQSQYQSQDQTSKTLAHQDSTSLVALSSDQCNNANANDEHQAERNRTSCLQVLRKLLYSLAMGFVIALCWMLVVHTLKWISIKGAHSHTNSHNGQLQVPGGHPGGPAGALLLASSQEFAARHPRVPMMVPPDARDVSTGAFETPTGASTSSPPHSRTPAGGRNASSSSASGPRARQPAVSRSRRQPGAPQLQSQPHSPASPVESADEPPEGEPQDIPARRRQPDASGSASNGAPSNGHPSPSDDMADVAGAADDPDTELGSMLVLQPQRPPARPVAATPPRAPALNAPTPAGATFKAPFFTSWYISMWNMLFMPVFTIISSCCFRGEDSTTKRLLVRESISQFMDNGLTTIQFLVRCALFASLWIATIFGVVYALASLDATAVMALFSFSSSLTYFLSWVVLHQQFVGIRIVAVIICTTGIALLAYMDNSRTLGSVLIVTGSAFCSAIYKVVYQRMFGFWSIAQMSLFFTLIGLFNAFLMWPIVLLLYFLGVELIVWRYIPWMHLTAAGALHLTANVLAYFGPICTYDIFLTMGLLLAVALSAVIDVSYYQITFVGMKLAGVLLLSIGFLVCLLPENWNEFLYNLLHKRFANWKKRRSLKKGSRNNKVQDMATGHISRLRTASGRVK